ATGSANCDFESDLIVWRGGFSAYGSTAREAYRSISNDAKLVKEYLEKNGVTEDEMVFSSVTIDEHWVTKYNDDGNRIGEYLDGYDLYQNISITSTDLDKIEGVSRDISELIESNVQFVSYEPEYYYTKLDELKLELIEEATQNAKARIDIMAEGSGTQPDELLNASLGVFQITAQNSNTEYSYGGTFDTSSRLKNASVTVKLNYSVQ
ncbi:MAG: SIMPL domain-containing protein, partial [Lachnospiraceae bacterium]|nr:SIMPL domain-containing protein [Lachnospiraceae bacterium]